MDTMMVLCGGTEEAHAAFKEVFELTVRVWKLKINLHKKHVVLFASRFVCTTSQLRLRSLFVDFFPYINYLRNRRYTWVYLFSFTAQVLFGLSFG